MLTDASFHSGSLLLCRKLGLFPRRFVRNAQQAVIWIFVRLRLIHCDRVNANIVTRNIGYERSLRRDRPRLDVTFEKVRVLLDKIRGRFIAARARHFCRAG
jgi:hypothetical protein